MDASPLPGLREQRPGHKFKLRDIVGSLWHVRRLGQMQLKSPKLASDAPVDGRCSLQVGSEFVIPVAVNVLAFVMARQFAAGRRVMMSVVGAKEFVH